MKNEYLDCCWYCFRTDRFELPHGSCFEGRKGLSMVKEVGNIMVF